MKLSWLAPLLIGLSIAVQASQPPGGDRYSEYLQGLIEEKAGHLSQALARYQEVVHADPKAIEVYRDIAQLGLQMNQPQTALNAALQVSQLAPTDPNSFIFLGNVHVAQGNLAQAAAAYEEALKLDPNNLPAMENLANYYALLDSQKALSYYERYLANDPNDPEIYFQMGLLQQKIGHDKEAQSAFEKAIAIDPDQLPPHLALAELFEVQKSTPAAVEQYQKAIELQPRNAVLYFHLGHLHFANQEWDAAYSDFQNAKALEPKDSSVYYWLARCCEERHQWPQAADYAMKAYALTKDPQFLPLTAYYLTLDHQLKAAVGWLKKARRLDPKNPNVLLFLGMDYLDLNEVKKADEALSQGVAAHPDDTQLRFQLGVAEDRLGRTKNSEAQFNAILLLDPKNADAMNYLGYSWADRGIQLGQAEKLLRQAVALDPSNGAYWDSLGWVRYKQGDADEAARSLEQAAHLEPDPLIFDHLGDAYAKQQRYDKAMEAWAKSLAMDPKNARVKRKLKETSSHVLPTTDPRKHLKYIEGNFRQIRTLHGSLVVKALWKKYPLNAEGVLDYARPTRLVFTLQSPTTPAPRITMEGQQVHIEPDTFAKQASELPLSSLSLIADYLSGTLLAPFDTAQVLVSTTSQALHYTSPAKQEAWVDAARGLLMRVDLPSSGGGTDEISFEEYQLIEGLWLPGTIELRNTSQKWDARFSCSQWEINTSTADASP